MSSFDELMGELEDAGVDPDYIERIRKATEASPIRRERDEAKAAAQSLKERNQKLEARILNQTFTEAGIRAKPESLRLPEDLDVTDLDKVKGWAVEAGLIEAPGPDTPDEEMDAHERVAAASAGAEAPAAAGVLTPSQVGSWAPDKWMRFKQKNPDAAEALMRGEEVRGVAV